MCIFNFLDSNSSLGRGFNGRLGKAEADVSAHACQRPAEPAPNGDGIEWTGRETENHVAF